MSTPSIEITLDRIDRIYHPGDKVTGAILIDSKSSLSYSSLRLQIEGNIQLQLSARSIGLFEAFYSSLKPIQLINLDTEIASGGKLQAGITEFPFEFELKSTNSAEELYETYHGVYININYQIHADFNRGLMAKNIKKTKEFYVEQHANKEIRKKEEKAKPFLFKIAPESLQNVKESSKKKIPEFAFEGDLSHLNCLIDEPMVGNLLIKKCAVDIKSIELQLVRVEVIKYMEGEAREATEIQNIQIAEGNISRGLSIPLFMIFPRLFTCSSIKTNNFQIEFEVNLIVLFADNHMVTENFPIKLYR